MSEKNIVFGRHPVVDAISAGRSVEKILLQQSIKGDFEKEIRQLCRKHNIQLQYVPKEKLNRTTKGNHQGIIAFVASIVYQTLSDLLPLLLQSETAPLILVLDGITDVRNIGAIARTAEAMGVDALVIPQQGGGMINSDAVKASAGTLSSIAVCREPSLLKAIGILQNNDLQVLATDLKGTGKLAEMDFKRPTAVILGSEGKGVSSVLLKAADERFIIPQLGKTESLNVSVATGMILYEAMQQRIK